MTKLEKQLGERLQSIAAYNDKCPDPPDDRQAGWKIRPRTTSRCVIKISMDVEVQAASLVFSCPLAVLACHLWARGAPYVGIVGKPQGYHHVRFHFLDAKNLSPSTTSVDGLRF